MDIVINGIYKHYKGNKYKVIGIGRHSESDEELVIYQALYGENCIWCRTINMWNYKIEIDGKIIKRFELIKDWQWINLIIKLLMFVSNLELE